MKVLLLESELIVKKDLTIQLLRHGCQVCDDPKVAHFDCVIIGQNHLLQQLSARFGTLRKDMRMIFFTTDKDCPRLQDFPNTVLVPRPAQPDAIIRHLQEIPQT